MSTVTKSAEQLQEAWGDVVATNDSGWLQVSDSGYGTTLARYQRPATTLYDRTDGRFLPVYQTEFDLAVIRAMGRTLAQVSPALVGAIRSMCNYTIGEGFTFTANRDDTADLSPSKSQKLVNAVQREINTLLDDTDFIGSFDREIHNSSIEDGEAFLHLKPSPCGKVRISRCEPDQVRQPASSRELEDWVSHTFGIACDEFVSSWSFGVHTRVDEPDVALGYHVVADETGVNWEYIPAWRMEHIKRNVPRNAKRGFSDLYPIEADSTRGEKLRRNMAEGAAVQSAIAYVRQHVQGATRVGVEQMLGENKVGTSQQSPWSGGRSRSVVQYRPGTVVDLSAGLEYKPGPMGSDRANDFMVVAQYVQRMQAVRWSMPEYMFTGDASNANYSSTLVAESPFVKSCEAEQRFYSRHFVNVIWKALQIRWELGAFDQFGLHWEEIEQTIEIKAECPAVATRDELANVQRQEILIRLGILSRKTAASQNGLDFETEVELGAKPEGEDSAAAEDDDNSAGGQVGLAEHVLFECGGKGGKPGPCPKNLPDEPKKGRYRKAATGSTRNAGAKRNRQPASALRSGDPTKPLTVHSTPATHTAGAKPKKSKVSGAAATTAKNYKPNTSKRQRYAAKVQRHLSNKVGGTVVENNAPADVVIDGGFVEVKAKLDGESHSIRMSRAALDRKARTSHETGHPFHTVVMDRRHKYLLSKNKGANFSDHPIYYKRGAGSFQLSEMVKVTSYEQLKELMSAAEKDLPPAGKPTAEWTALVADVPKFKGDRGKLKGARAIAAQSVANKAAGRPRKSKTKTT